MWKWFRRGRSGPEGRPQSAELRGAPEHARVKTFSSETGYVYQYVYRGYRRMDNGLGMEHVFEANRDRAQRFRVTVHLLDEEVAKCREAIGRELIGAEKYALVKMTLFAALDRFTNPGQFDQPLVPNAAEMEEYLRTLGRV